MIFPDFPPQRMEMKSQNYSIREVGMHAFIVEPNLLYFCDDDLVSDSSSSSIQIRLGFFLASWA